ncbi:hypothetical protein MAHJHV59_47540 [Mycobacterium avium subsp. hominissuis]
MPPDVPADVAALLGCAVLTGGGAGRPTLSTAPGQTVAVVGLGGVGMAALLTALTYDGVPVVAVVGERGQQRRHPDAAQPDDGDRLARRGAASGWRRC